VKKEGANTEEIETTTTIGVLVEKFNDKTFLTKVAKNTTENSTTS